MLGICAGDSYAVNAALTGQRFKVVGTVAVVNLGRARHQGLLAANAVPPDVGCGRQQRTA